MAAADPPAFHTVCEVYRTGEDRGRGREGRTDGRTEGGGDGGGGAGTNAEVLLPEPVEQPFYLRAVVETVDSTGRGRPDKDLGQDHEMVLHSP